LLGRPAICETFSRRRSLRAFPSRKPLKVRQTSIIVGLVAAIIAVCLVRYLVRLPLFGKGLVISSSGFITSFTSNPYILLILAFAAVFSSSLCLLSFAYTDGHHDSGHSLGDGYLSFHSCWNISTSLREYVRAAEAIGVGHMRRMFVHILPNVSHVIFVQLSLHVVGFYKSGSHLSFLGFWCSC